MRSRRAIIVHGGAGRWTAAAGASAAQIAVEDARRASAVAGCRQAAEAGARVLAAGGGALDAVEAAVRVLEDDETFNAGRGAVLTRDGTVEHDALVVDGQLRAGAVGALAGFRAPVSIARRLLEAGEHVLLVGAGARAFALEAGFREVEAAELITARAHARWQAGLAGSPADTVGACALDAVGRVAAATSTGGTAHKRSGRVGDSPIVGAGGFADDRLGAISATGHGESILRVGLSRGVAERLRLGEPLDDACRGALAELVERTGGTGGLVAVDVAGHVSHATVTPHMPLASVVEGVADAGIDR